MTQAAQTDFGWYGQLSESEQEILNQALASIPEDILSTGERPAINSRIRRRLEREGLLPTGDAGGPLGVGQIPPVAYVGRAVGCLAATYVSLRGISHNKPAKVVAESIARTVGGCVPGDVDAVSSDILTYRKEIAKSLSAIGLPALGDALVAKDAGTYQS